MTTSESNSAFTNAAARLILKIKEKHKIPSCVVESVVQDMKELFAVSSQLYCTCILLLIILFGDPSVIISVVYR